MEGWIREKKLPFDEKEYAELLDLYEKAAPVSFPPPILPPGPGPLEFAKGEVGQKATTDRPKVTHVEVTDLDQDGKKDVIVCDDVAGRVSWLKIEKGAWEEIHLANLVTPARTEVLDYNGDGHLDIVVASLGFVSPTDDLIGSVWLLVNRGDLTFEPLRLLHDVARVADVAPGDFDGDGKIDFAVAAFGWRTSGEVVLLKQLEPTLFLRHRIIQQNGAMQVEAADLDQDGHLDVVVMFAQEHESLEWFRNDGEGRFERRILAKAPHPAFGSSGFSLVDFDGDGDLDIVHTNGDMMDEVSLSKPYHGVRWLENIKGTFQAREIYAMPGCYNAVPHDLDGDGDLDLVVSNLYFDWGIHDSPSLVWLENQGDMSFRPHLIARAPTNIPAMDVGDLDQDGFPDIITGGFHLPGPLGRSARLTAFFRQIPP